MNRAVAIVTTCTYTLASSSTGMCEDLLMDAGYDPDEHREAVDAMAFAADLAQVDAAYDVMREYGLKPIADQERERPGTDGGDQA